MTPNSIAAAASGPEVEDVFLPANRPYRPLLPVPFAPEVAGLLEILMAAPPVPPTLSFPTHSGSVRKHRSHPPGAGLPSCAYCSRLGTELSHLYSDQTVSDSFR